MMAAGWYRWGMQLDFHKQMEGDPETAQGIHSAASAVRLSTVLCIYTNGGGGGGGGGWEREEGEEDGECVGNKGGGRMREEKYVSSMCMCCVCV